MIMLLLVECCRKKRVKFLKMLDMVGHSRWLTDGNGH